MFFLHVGNVFMLIMATFLAASTAVIMSAYGVNDRNFAINATSGGHEKPITG